MICCRQSESLHCKLRVALELGENVELWYHNGFCVWPKCIHREDSPPTLLTRVPYLMRKVKYWNCKNSKLFYTPKQKFFVWKVKACAVVMRLWYHKRLFDWKTTRLDEQQSKHFTWLLKASLNFFKEDEIVLHPLCSCQALRR